MAFTGKIAALSLQFLLLGCSSHMARMDPAVAGMATSAPASASAETAATPVQRFGALSVRGNRIVDAQGRAVALSGVSHFWSNTGFGQEAFYNPETVAYFAKDWHASLFRAAMGADSDGSYLDDPQANRKRAETVIDAAIANGAYVIIDWHSHHAERNPREAMQFFTAMARKYGGTPNVIYEIYNEPLADTRWKDDVKPYALKVIAAIRSVDPDNIIIVGSPHWSQDADIAAQDPIAGYVNIAYTMHFYAGTHKADLRTRTQAALDAGLPIVVTEWGTINADGDGAVAAAETRRWVEFMDENCLSNANWAVSNKREGASIFKPGTSPTGPWSDADLTASGRLVKQIVLNGTRVCG